jgi:cbb3-type cytochrome oxidase subunit 1
MSGPTIMIQSEPRPTKVIDHSMLVSEISRKYPQCRPVFEKYGIAGCGGEYGPPEPLFIFAAAHRVPLRELVEELNRAMRGEWKDESGTRKAEGMAEADGEVLYKRYVFGALFVALTAGFGLGLVNLTRIALAQSYYEISGVLKQIHGHAQVFGWVGLFVMGVSFHAVPRMKMQPLRHVHAARSCFWLMLGGVLLRVIAQPLARNSVAAAALLISGAMELAAISVFVWLLGGSVVRSQQEREPYEKFIGASVAWFAVLGLWNFWIVLQMVWKRSVGIPALQDALWIHAAFFGFIANMIFGFSLRVLPHFLGLRESKTWAANVAFVLWNVAIFLRYPLERLAWAASVLEAVAIVLFVWALGVFARRRAKIEIKGVDNTFAWFVYLGYAWLLIAAATPFHADVFRLSASSRHTLAIGFITPLIFGVSYRVLPIFNGVNLWSTRLMRVSFWHLAAGSTLAFSMALNNVFETTWSYAWSGVAGYLVFAALVMFAVNIALTLRTRAEKFTHESIVTLTTRVTELLEIHPDIRPVLIHGGLAGLAAMQHNPPRFVTIEFAARRHGIDPQPLIKFLNEEIQRRTHHESHSDD